MIKIYTDGASRGNPGEASAGVVIYRNEEVIAEIRKYLGVQTNNWAEYEAVFLALQRAHNEGLSTETISVFLDSKLVAEQLSGNWKIKMPTLQVQHEKITRLLKESFHTVTFTHIRREHNAYADRLANEALDAHE